MYSETIRREWSKWNYHKVKAKLTGKKAFSNKSYQLFIVEDEANRDLKEAIFFLQLFTFFINELLRK